MQVKHCGKCPFWVESKQAAGVVVLQQGQKRVGTCYGSVPDTHLAPAPPPAPPGSIQVVNARPSCNSDDIACSIPNSLPLTPYN